MALKGRHLLVGADIWVPWVDLHERPDGSLGSTGVASAFFDIIANKLNFTYTLQLPADRESGRGMPNGSFTGIIGMCQRKEVDMGLGPFGVTYERSRVVDFSIPLFDDSFGIFLPRPRLESDITAIVKPLAPEVWLYLAVAICISMLIGLILNLILHEATKDNLNVREGRQEVEIRPSWIIMVLLQEPLKTLPFSTTAKIYLITWLVAGLILSTAYSGVLTSILAVPRVTIPVDSLQDLVRQTKIPWANEFGTSLHQLFSEATSGLYKTINDEASLVTSCYAARDRIKNERMAVLCDVFSMKKIMSDDFGVTESCNYYIAQKKVKSVSLSFAFPKGSELTQHFDRWLGPLKESGLVSRSVMEITANATACLVKPGKEGNNAHVITSLKDLAGLFIILFAGFVSSAFVLVVEHWVAWYHGHGKEEHNVIY